MPKLQMEWWAEASLPGRMGSVVAHDFVIREGTTDPFKFGPLQEFLDVRKTAKVPFVTISFCCQFVFMLTLFSHLGQVQTSATKIRVCANCHQGFTPTTDKATKCVSCTRSLRREPKGYRERRKALWECVRCKKL